MRFVIEVIERTRHARGVINRSKTMNIFYIIGVVVVVAVVAQVFLGLHF